MSIPGLPSEVEFSGKAIGLLNDAGNLDAGWFEEPVDRLESILSDPEQRAALLALLDAILPPENLGGLRPGEKWHPLLGLNPRGNVYLVVRTSGDHIDVGFGALLQSTAGAPATALKLRLPVVRCQGTNINPIAGTTSGPLEVDLRVVLNWTRGVEAIGLRAISITGSLSPIGPGASANLTVVLEQLDLDGSGPRDTALDPTQLDSQALDLILGLIQERLHQISATAIGEAARVTANLGTLLGLDGTIPRFPFDRLTQGPAALQAWFNQLIDTGRIVDWLSAFGRMMGANVAASGSGTTTDPWRIRIIDLNGGPSGVDVTLVRKTGPVLDIGLRTALLPDGANPAVLIEAQAALASIPLSGTAAAVVLPSAEVVVRAPGDASDLVNSATITIERLRTGLRWNGSNLIPLLELLNVTFAGSQYDRIDLTNTDSVAAAASAAVETALRNALGAGAGARLAALAGLIRPSGDPTWPHTLNPATLVTNPAAAIAGVHRAALLDAAHNWSFLLEEFAGLVGLAGPVTGLGTRTDPWRVLLGPGPLRIELAAWNEQTSGVAADPQLLRIGFRATATNGPMSFRWLAELLAFDLPASGSGDVRLMAGQHASFFIEPLPALPERNGIVMNADSIGITMDWTPGGSMLLQGVVTNLDVTIAGVPTNIPQLAFPPPGGLDVTNPVALGVPVGSLETLFRTLLANGFVTWMGRRGAVLASLLGLHRELESLPADWPILRDPAGPGSLFSDPTAAIRDWLNRVATDLSADGTPHLRRALAALRTLLADNIPPLSLPFRGDELPISGSGTYEHPWSLPLSRVDSRPVELLVWLEPDGPPASWASNLNASIIGAVDLAALIGGVLQVADFVPNVRNALAGFSPDQIITSLTLLNGYFNDSDGIVPIASQVPTGATWTAGTAFQSAHHRQPSHASAVAQIRAQIDTWQPGGPKAVLLLGPSFASRDSWNALLAAAEAANPGSTSVNAHFNLRVPGADPLTISLSSTTAIADYYTADLQDTGIGDIPGLTAQISRLANRIAELRSGVPLIIVAHSTSGVAARAFTASNPARVRGLITLGTPHRGALLTPVRNPDAAAAVRWIRATGVSFPAGPLKDAIDHIVEAIDGFRRSPDGELPQSIPYPVGSFAGTASTDTGGVPALALGSTLGSSLLDELKQSLGTMATNVAAAPTPAPTHISFGIRASLGLPPAGSDLSVEATLRADAFRVALRPGVAEPARPRHSLIVNIVLERPGGWLVGTPQAHTGVGSPIVDVRLRRAELGATITRNGGGQLNVTPRVELYDGAFHGLLEPVIELGNPLAAPLLGALFERLSTPAPLAGSGIDLLLDSLQALGIAVPDPSGGIGLSAEGLTAVTLDGAAFLAPKLRFAFSLPGGVGAFEGPENGPWVLPISGLPLEVFASTSEIGLRTKEGSTLPIGVGSLSFTSSLSVPGFNSSFTGAAQIAQATLSFSGSPATLTIAIPPWLESFTLFPTPAPAAFVAAFNTLVPRLMLSSAVSAFLENIVGPGFNIGPIDLFLSSPARSTSGSGALGNGGFLDSTKINALLNEIGRAIGAPAGTGLTLPGNLRLSASGTEPITLRFETAAAIGGVVSFQLDANIDRQFHVTPAGQLSIQTPLAGIWPAVEITFGISPAGVTLLVRPQGVAPIQILPTFSGFGSLALAGAALLPSALDALINSFGAVRPRLVNLVLDVATALDLFDNAGGFAAHNVQLRAMLNGSWFASFSIVQQAQIAAAIEQLFSNAASPLRGHLPGEFSTAANTVVWAFPTTAAPELKIIFGWDSSGPTLIVRSSGFRSGDAPFEIDFGGGYASGTVVAETAIAVRLLDSIGVAVKPQFKAAFTGGSFQIRFLPLGASSDGSLRIDIAPSPGVQLGADGIQELVAKWLLPLVGSNLLTPGLNLDRTLWTGGKTVRQLLVGAEIIDGGGHLRSPLPPVDRIIARLMVTLATGIPPIPITPTLSLSPVSDSRGFGAKLTGKIEFQAGTMTASILFGDPPSAITDADRGVTVYLFRTSGGTEVVDPRLHVVGLGFGLAGRDGAPLVNTAVFRLGAFGAFLFFDVNFLNVARSPQLSVTEFGAGLLLDQFGIPLGQALNQNLGGDNPVAASLLRSDSGTSGGSGDPQPVNPEVDIILSYRHGNFSIRFGGVTAIWIPVQRTFGPIYIDQLGVILEGNTAVSLLVDGSVKVAALTVQADDLGVRIPFDSLLTPGDWRLELRGLAVSFQEGSISIAGGLLKDPGPPVQYAGMLLVSVAGRGFTAVGAYAKPSANGDSFTSFFVFASLGFPLGGPPYFFVLGLGGGMGYNRRLLVPEDVGQIGNFLLVSAIDNSNFANDPMGALRAMLVSVPPSRGSLWLAAGLKFTSFALLEGIAVIYIALDRGFEIGLLGLARMALPRPEFPIAMVELAIKARFSTAEMVLSVQAQLTDNSFIFHRSCRLTGGFAFFIWFRTGEFVLTLGGYHPAFNKPPHFPIVPRLGFHWSIGDNITVKGEAYFALTTSCVMAGGRLEASAEFGPIRAWFIAYADILISWDPFYYQIDIGISVGVEARIRICFFVCGTIHIRVSVGAHLHIEGPPFHGTVTVEYWVISVTIPFGDAPQAKPTITWQAFKQKYLTASDPENTAVGIQMADGLLAPEPPGASPAPGTQAQPWRLGTEFSFTTETRMPAESLLDQTGAIVPLGVESLDIAPVRVAVDQSSHFFGIVRLSDNSDVGFDADHWEIKPRTSPFPEATWRMFDEDDVPAAARNIQAVSGLDIKAVSFLHGKSDLIRVIGVVDDDPTRSLPLPFSTVDPVLVNRMVAFGTAAQSIVESIADRPTAKLLNGAEAVLSGEQFARARIDSSLPDQGLSPLAKAALRNARSSPPLIEPLSTGLTMKPVGLPEPATIVRVPPEPPVILDRARLRAVFQTKPQVVAAVTPSIKTSIASVAAQKIPRMAPPKPKQVPGARLHIVSAKGAPRPTVASTGTRTLRNLDAGFWAAEGERQAFDKAAADIVADGVKIPAGVMHVWDLPVGGRRRVVLSGQAAARIIFLDNAGTSLEDIELIVDQSQTIDVPPTAVRVAVTCLGVVPPGLLIKTPGFGVVSELAAPAGAAAATGWLAGHQVLQLSSTLFVARGAIVITSRPQETLIKNQRSTQAVVLAANVVSDTEIVETRLPLGTDVVAVMLDRQDATAADQGDLTLAADGATLTTPPVAVGFGSRRILLYDVSQRDDDARLISISAASKSGWRIAGVAGLAGRAIEWAARFNSSVPEYLVPDGPLTPNGSLTVQFTIEET